MLYSLLNVEVTGRNLQQFYVDVFITLTFVATHAHLNVITHFLWENPVEPRQPSLVAAAVAFTKSITVPQWVINSNSVVVFPSASDSELAVVILPNKCRGNFTWYLGTGTVVDPICPIAIIRKSCCIRLDMVTRS